MDDAIAVALKIIARGRRHLRVPPTTRLIGMTRVQFKHSNDR
jgi:hypothetical protein